MITRDELKVRINNALNTLNKPGIVVHKRAVLQQKLFGLFEFDAVQITVDDVKYLLREGCSISQLQDNWYCVLEDDRYTFIHVDCNYVSEKEPPAYILASLAETIDYTKGTWVDFS